MVNPVGETEASLKVENDRLTINRQGKVEEWRGNWRGIPVEFVHRLMLGGVPCVSKHSTGRKRLAIAEDELRVILSNLKGYSEEYRYGFVLQDNSRVIRDVIWKATVPGAPAPEVAVTVWGVDWKAIGREHELEVRWRRRSVDTGG